MSNYSTTNNDFFEVYVSFEQQFQDNSERKVRMIWHAKNISEERIRIRAYYCPFYTGTKKWGVFTQGRWVKERFKISNDHILTYLYPKEERSFIWEWVDPSYYGLKGNQLWNYRLEIYYTVDGDPTDRKIECRSKSLRIEEEQHELIDRLGPFTSPEIIRPLVRAFPTITGDFDERMNIERDLVPYGRAAIVPDAVLRTDSELVVLQLATYTSRKDLERVNQAVSNLNQWAQDLSLNVIGVILATNDDELIRKIVEKEYPKLRIMLMEIGNTPR